MALTTGDKIGLWAIIVALLIGVSALFNTEVRQFVGVESSNKTIEQTETSNITVERAPTSNTINSNLQNSTEPDPPSIEQFVVDDVIATRFDVDLSPDTTIVSIHFKLKDENKTFGSFYPAPGNSYLADPNGKIYEMKSSGETRSIRQNEVYIERLVFERLESKPPFLYLHYKKKYVPVINLQLNWLN